MTSRAAQVLQQVAATTVVIRFSAAPAVQSKRATSRRHHRCLHGRHRCHHQILHHRHRRQTRKQRLASRVVHHEWLCPYQCGVLSAASSSVTAGLSFGWLVGRYIRMPSPSVTSMSRWWTSRVPPGSAWSQCRASSVERKVRAVQRSRCAHSARVKLIHIRGQIASHFTIHYHRIHA